MNGRGDAFEPDAALSRMRHQAHDVTWSAGGEELLLLHPPRRRNNTSTHDMKQAISPLFKQTLLDWCLLIMKGSDWLSSRQ